MRGVVSMTLAVLGLMSRSICMKHLYSGLRMTAATGRFEHIGEYMNWDTNDVRATTNLTWPYNQHCNHRGKSHSICDKLLTRAWSWVCWYKAKGDSLNLSNRKCSQLQCLVHIWFGSTWSPNTAKFFSWENTGLTRRAIARIGTASKVLANKVTTTTSNIGLAHLQFRVSCSLPGWTVAAWVKMLLLFGLVYHIRVGGRFVKSRQGQSHSLEGLGSDQVLPAVVSSESVYDGIHRPSAGFCHALLRNRQLQTATDPLALTNNKLTHHD